MCVTQVPESKVCPTAATREEWWWQVLRCELRVGKTGQMVWEQLTLWVQRPRTGANTSSNSAQTLLEARLSFQGSCPGCQ